MLHVPGKSLILGFWRSPPKFSKCYISRDISDFAEDIFDFGTLAFFSKSLNATFPREVSDFGPPEV